MTKVIRCLGVVLALAMPLSSARADDKGDAALAQGLQQLLDIATDAYNQAEQDEQQQQPEGTAGIDGSQPGAEVFDGSIPQFMPADFGAYDATSAELINACHVEIQTLATVYLPWFLRDPGQFTVEQGHKAFTDNVGGMLRGIMGANRPEGVRKDLAFHRGLGDGRDNPDPYYHAVYPRETQVWICFDEVRLKQVSGRK